MGEGADDGGEVSMDRNSKPPDVKLLVAVYRDVAVDVDKSQCQDLRPVSKATLSSLKNDLNGEMISVWDEKKSRWRQITDPANDASLHEEACVKVYQPIHMVGRERAYDSGEPMVENSRREVSLLVRVYRDLAVLVPSSSCDQDERTVNAGSVRSLLDELNGVMAFVWDEEKQFWRQLTKPADVAALQYESRVKVYQPIHKDEGGHPTPKRRRSSDEGDDSSGSSHSLRDIVTPKCVLDRFRSLSGAVLEVDGEHEVLNLKSPIEIGLSLPAIFVHPIYKHLYEYILNPPRPLQARRMWLIRGTAGVGKSFFQYYVAWRRLQLKKTVVWHEHKADGVLVIQNGGASMTTVSIGQAHDYVNDPNNWYLCDDEEPIVNDNKAVTVLTASPRSGTTFRRYDKCARGLWMDIWSLDQLLCCANIYRNIPDWEVDEKMLRVAYDLLGGIPRYLLQRATDFDELKQKLEAQIIQCRIEHVTAMGDAVFVESMSNMIFHCRATVPKQAIAPGADTGLSSESVSAVQKPFALSHVDFCSRGVGNQVIAAIVRHGYDKLLDLVAACNVHPLEVIRGRALEKIVAALLMGGIELRMRHLTKSGMKEFLIQLPKMDKHDFWGLDLAPVKQFLEPAQKVSVYCRPLLHNFPVSDAFVVLDQPFIAYVQESQRADPSLQAVLGNVQCVLVQITTAKTHSMTPNQFAKQIKELDTNVLVWVMPENEGYTQMQSLGGMGTTTPDQFVIEIPKGTSPEISAAIKEAILADCL